jgi:hypothetical protein
LRDLHFEPEVSLPLLYKGLKLGCGYKLDLIVHHEIILELKSVEEPYSRSAALDVAKIDREEDQRAAVDTRPNLGEFFKIPRFLSVSVSQW